ncbi:GntR family transcriptional regulator [Arthrobacter sp. FW305-BF8]|uniref:GntR family transcriptional regulator n=1 Tax=Arthrobacter sp. FW305-BF8 TaxID=2879617 RepID=UPI001F16EF5B|nr:GntR family transcriptional regulator [Arthrobacter sp. FW305-BF8]UKA53821.1 GntR family transcriptional regulator [Arthrobacter sp. FW305-BF8]
MATVNPSSGVARLRVAVPAVATRVASELRLQIAEGALLPGTKLKEEALSEELGVSRNTVREAFAELASERLVVRQPNRGVFVASLEVSDIHDVYAVRRAIEVSAVRGGGSADSIAAVRAAVEEGKRAAAAGDSEGLGSANAHFHGALVAMAGSERLNVIMSQVLAEMRLFFHKASIDGGFYQDYLADNDRICSALEAGDNDLAAERLLSYLARSEEHQAAVHTS